MKKTFSRLNYGLAAALFAVFSVAGPLLAALPAKAATVPFTLSTIEAAQAPWGKNLADVDGDGLLDAITGGGGQGTNIYWYKNPSWTKFQIGTLGGDDDLQVGDINNDGATDVIVNGGIAWYENPHGSGGNAQGPWTHHVIDTANSHDLQVGDMNADGKLDVVTRGVGELGTTHVYLQGATADTWTKFRLNNAPYAQGTALTDIDRDGRMDVVGNGYWLKQPASNITDGTAWLRYTITLWTDGCSTTVADINKDGRMDVLLAPSEAGLGTLAWFENPTDPINGAWTRHDVSDGSMDDIHRFHVNDIDKDGNLDIVYAEMHQSATDRVGVFYGVSNGASWTHQTIAATGSHNIALGDVDNDGDTDIFGANWSATQAPDQGNLNLWKNELNSGSTPNAWSYITVDSTKTEKAFGLDFGDMNRDGQKDIIAGHYWYRNPGSNLNGAWTRTDLGAGKDAMLVLDVDSDGQLDIISQTRSTTAPIDITWHKPNDAAATTFTNTVIGTIPNTSRDRVSQGYELADIVPGGKPELVFSGDEGWYYFSIPANPAAGAWPRVQVNTDGTQEGIAAGDINKDGRVDLVGAWHGSRTTEGLKVNWWNNPGTGAGSWAKNFVGDTTAEMTRVEVADVNGDSLPDIIATEDNLDTQQGLLHWYEQTSTGGWVPHTIATGLGSIESMDIGDFTRDGKIDIVTGEHRGGNLATVVWANVGGGASWNSYTVDTGKESHNGARSADLDGDGDLEIVSIGYDTYQTVRLWRNDSIVGTPAPADVVDVWYGNNQVFGDKGTPQNWVNILGTADPTVTSLSYTLNGGVSKQLSIGADERRLARPGDFNIDLAITDLVPGSNTVRIIAADSAAGTVTEDVTVQYQNNQVWTLPYTADWSAATKISDVSQVVDGYWTLTPEGVRSSVPDYDRLVAIGDKAWTDYEVTVPITIHNVDFASSQTSQSGGRPAIGLIMRWTGHTDDPIAGMQPKSGWNPNGAIGWWRWNSDQTTAQLQHYGINNGVASTPVVGTTYLMKQRVETQPDGSSTYSMKVWEAGQPEPATWSLVNTVPAGGLANGSLALVAHHVDATYGNVTITPLGSGGDITPPVVSNVATTNVTQSSATVGWTTNEAASSRVEYGTDTAYGSTKTVAGFGTQHTVNLDALAPGTTYHYRVVSSDAASNQTVSADLTFTTATPDTTAPVISNVASNNVTATGATITWNTNEVSDSQVEYGTTTAYGQSTPPNATMVADHSASLSGLQPGTTYHYRVLSRDGAGNVATSTDETFTTPVVPPTLQGHWQFDEASGLLAADSSGNGRGGTLELGANFVSPGRFGNAVNFDGADDYVNIQPFDVSGQAMTISAWVNPDSFTGSYQDNRIISKANGSSEQSHYWMLSTFKKDTQTVLRFRLKAGGTTKTLIATTGNVPLNQWSHVVARYDGTTMKLYLNGTEVGWVGKTGAIDTDPTVGVNIGRNPGSNSSEWDGKIDDARVYSRALDAAEIQDLATGTPTDTTAPSISNVASSNVTTAGATVQWTTNEPADSLVEYGSTTAYGSSTPLGTNLTANHSADLSGLQAGTTYHYRVLSKDAAGNSAVSGDFTFTTAQPPVQDTTPPVISNIVSSNATTSSATITWDTDEPADSQVEYGTTDQFGSVTAPNTALTTSHSNALSGLQPGTTYHYRVLSRDGAGNVATSASATLTTEAAPPADATPPAISAVSSSNVTTNAATITWTTDEAADTQVEYGTTAAYGSSTPLNATLATSHSAGLSGLASNTTYHYRVLSRDSAGNLAASGDFSFTTEADPVPSPIAHIQNAAATSIGTSSAATISQAFDTPNTIGNTIVVAFSWGSNANPTCSDTQGNVYAIATRQYDSTKNQSLAVCYATNVKASANTVTVSFSASAKYHRLVIHEYSGIDTANPVDVTSMNNAVGTTGTDAITSGNATTTANGALIFGAIMDDTGTTDITAGTGFTYRNSVNNEDLFTQDMVQPTAGQVASTNTFALAHRYLSQMVAFRAVQ
ncbi:MAG: fibronectin type III domain-containing protein [Candidatus Saccharimonadales bacterium]